MTQSKRNRRGRNFWFTDNTKQPLDLYRKITGVRYITIGDEIGSKTKRPHWQGFIQFEKPLSFKSVLKKVPKGCHFGFCDGSAVQNIVYCSKENTVLELGEPKLRGQRTDLKSVYEDLKKGATMLEIADKHQKAFTRYYKAFERYKELYEKKSTKKFRKLNVIVLSGPTNTNKTRRAVENTDFLINAPDLKWWNGYNQEKSITIDEYDNDIKITKLLKLLDGYQQRLPIKGSHTYANWTTVYITTNLKKTEFHPKAKVQHREALFRRITTWIDLFPKVPQKVPRSEGNSSLTSDYPIFI